MSDSPSILVPTALAASLLAGYLYLSAKPALVRLSMGPGQEMYVDPADVVLVSESGRDLVLPGGNRVPLVRIFLDGSDKPLDVAHSLEQMAGFLPTLKVFTSLQGGFILLNGTKVLSVRRSGYVSADSWRSGTKIRFKNKNEVSVLEDPETVARTIAS